MSKSALSTFPAKEEEIEKRKSEVKKKVHTLLDRIEDETRRLATIRKVCRFETKVSRNINLEFDPFRWNHVVLWI